MIKSGKHCGKRRNCIFLFYRISNIAIFRSTKLFLFEPIRGLVSTNVRLNLQNGVNWQIWKKNKIDHSKPEQRTLFDAVWSGKDCINVFLHFRICSYDAVIIITIHTCKSLRENWDPMLNIDYFGKYRHLLSLSKTWKQGSDWLAERSSECDPLSVVLRSYA